MVGGPISGKDDGTVQGGKGGEEALIIKTSSSVML